MDFTMRIPSEEFRNFQLKVVSLAPIQVRVIDQNDQEVETFQTNANYSMYAFKTANTDIKEVICEVLPGVLYEFYPVVQAQ